VRVIHTLRHFLLSDVADWPQYGRTVVKSIKCFKNSCEIHSGIQELRISQ
jgi:hypothetical protein